MAKAEIARHLKISRRTGYNWIEAGELDRGADSGAVRYGPRPRRPSKLDPYKGIIHARLTEYPKLSAVRLFNEVQAAGYRAGYGQVKRYLRKVRPREPVEPVHGFETPPGHQGQVDFADFRLPWGRRHALIVVLGYSRLMWMRFYEAPDHAGRARPATGERGGRVTAGLADRDAVLPHRAVQRAARGRAGGGAAAAPGGLDGAGGGVVVLRLAGPEVTEGSSWSPTRARGSNIGAS